MREVRVDENEHTALNEGIKNVLKWCGNSGCVIEFKLADRMKERNLTVRQLSELSGLRIATISDLMTGKKGSLNFTHVFILMLVLRIDKLTDLVDFRFGNQPSEMVEEDAKMWVETGELPEATKILGLVIQEKIMINPDYDYEGKPPMDVLKHMIPIKGD